MFGTEPLIIVYKHSSSFMYKSEISVTSRKREEEKLDGII